MLGVLLQIRDNKVPLRSPLAGIVCKETKLLEREAVFLCILCDAMHSVVQILEFLNQCYHLYMLNT